MPAAVISCGAVLVAMAVVFLLPLRCPLGRFLDFDRLRLLFCFLIFIQLSLCHLSVRLGLYFLRSSNTWLRPVRNSDLRLQQSFLGALLLLT